MYLQLDQTFRPTLILVLLRHMALQMTLTTLFIKLHFANDGAGISGAKVIYVTFD